MGRAVRLIAAAGDCPEAGPDRADPGRRRHAIRRRGSGTCPPRPRSRSAAAATDIVFDAMSQRGLHLVAAGAVDAGMALLDEALAAVAGGEVRDLISVGAMYCKMLHACELTTDVRRAEEWLAAGRRLRRSAPTGSRSARSAAPTTAECSLPRVDGSTPSESW